MIFSGGVDVGGPKSSFGRVSLRERTWESSSDVF